MTVVNNLIYGGGDSVTGTAADLLTGKTLNNADGENVTGTMPNNGAQSATLTTQGASKVIPAGYTSGGTVNASITNLAAANIKQGVGVGGVAGSFPSDGSAAIGQSVKPLGCCFCRAVGQTEP